MRRAEVTQTIFDYLKTSVPEVPWSVRLSGANRSKEVEGTVSCDRVSFQYDTKDSLVAKAIYGIYILDANSTENVDALADKVFAVLNNDDLGGVVICGDITQIQYGSKPGMAGSGVAMLTYVVEYYEELGG